MDLAIDPAQLDGWIPFRLDWKHPEPSVEWFYLGDQRFTAPFFTETQDRNLRRPFNLLFRHRTPIGELQTFRSTRPGLTPSGFIFHLSRSGSTLVSQMLAAVTANIVVSEARVIDIAIRSYAFAPSAREAQRVEWLKLIIELLGRPRHGEKNFIIKFDAWSMLDFQIVRRAFPDVPWIFVYRDPVEVMVSQFARRGAQMIPGALDPRLFGMDLQTAEKISPEEFGARVLASICKAALKHHQAGGLLVNYQQLPNLVWEQILSFFNLAHSENELSAIRLAAQRDAKNPAFAFQNDSEQKRQNATPAIRDAADKWLYPVYNELERAREAQPLTENSAAANE